MTTSPPDHHREARIALTTTAKLQQLRANSREVTTFAESCNDRETQRPWSDKLETAQLLQNVYEMSRRFMAVVVSSAFRKSLKNAVENRGLYRVYVSRLFYKGSRHWSTTIRDNGEVELPKRFRMRRSSGPTCVKMQDRARQGLLIALPIAWGIL